MKLYISLFFIIISSATSAYEKPVMKIPQPKCEVVDKCFHVIHECVRNGGFTFSAGGPGTGIPQTTVNAYSTFDVREKKMITCIAYNGVRTDYEKVEDAQTRSVYKTKFFDNKYKKITDIPKEELEQMTAETLKNCEEARQRQISYYGLCSDK